jgi:hypothetical protein
MKCVLRFMFIFSLLAIVAQSDNAFADVTVRGGRDVEITNYSGSFAANPMTGSNSSGEAITNMGHSWMIQRPMDMSISEYSLNHEEAPSAFASPVGGEVGQLIELS